jgi:hypothetical protein
MTLAPPPNGPVRSGAHSPARTISHLEQRLQVPPSQMTTTGSVQSSDQSSDIELQAVPAPPPTVPAPVLRPEMYQERLSLAESDGIPEPNLLEVVDWMQREEAAEQTEEVRGYVHPRGRPMRRADGTMGYSSDIMPRITREQYEAFLQQERNRPARPDSPYPGMSRPAGQFGRSGDASAGNVFTGRTRRATSPFPILAPPPPVRIHRRDRGQTVPIRHARGTSPPVEIQNESDIPAEYTVPLEMQLRGQRASDRDLELFMAAYTANRRDRFVERSQASSPQRVAPQVTTRWYSTWKGRSFLAGFVAMMILVLISSTAGVLAGKV